MHSTLDCRSNIWHNERLLEDGLGTGSECGHHDHRAHWERRGKSSHAITTHTHYIAALLSIMLSWDSPHPHHHTHTQNKCAQYWPEVKEENPVSNTTHPHTHYYTYANNNYIQMCVQHLYVSTYNNIIVMLLSATWRCVLTSGWL